jgi:hypothetical protein
LAQPQISGVQPTPVDTVSNFVGRSHNTLTELENHVADIAMRLGAATPGNTTATKAAPSVTLLSEAESVATRLVNVLVQVIAIGNSL